MDKKENIDIKWDEKAVKNFENYLKQAGMLFGEIKYKNIKNK